MQTSTGPGVPDAKADVRVGINVDPAAGGAATAQRLATLADDAGFDLLGIQDHLAIPEYLDCWTLVCALASGTRRISVVTDVANTALRSPVVLAKAAASLQILTGGRVVLGLGAGMPGPGVPSLGGPRWASAGESVTAFAESIQVVRLLQRPGPDPVHFAGTHFSLDGAVPGPSPDQPVPIWIGAVGPRMLRLVGRHADGWLAPASTHAPPTTSPERQRVIDEAATAAGRDPGTIRRTYALVGTVTTDGQGHEEDGEPLSGPPSFWVDTIGRYARELGFDTIVFCSLGDPIAQAELFAERVLPQVTARPAPPS